MRCLGTVEPSVRMDVEAKLAAEHSRRSGGKHKQELAVADEPCVFRSHSSHLLSLEPIILKGLGRAPEERCRATVVATAPREIALSEPGRGGVGT